MKRISPGYKSAGFAEREFEKVISVMLLFDDFNDYYQL